MNLSPKTNWPSYCLNLIAQYRAEETLMKLQFVHYFDVWGNQEDGYDVNDVRGYQLETDALPSTQQDVLQILIDNDQVHDNVTLQDVSIEIDEFGAEITEVSNNKPFGRLQF